MAWMQGPTFDLEWASISMDSHVSKPVSAEGQFEAITGLVRFSD